MDIELLAGAFFVLIVPTLATAGVASLLFVWFPKARRVSRVAIATIGTPIAVFGPVFGLIVADGQPVESLEWTMVLLLIAAPTATIGLPIAYFLSRSLDSQRVAGTEIFE